MIGHPDDCTCHGCAIRPPITNGHADPWRPGETWRTETLPWLVGQRAETTENRKETAA